MKLARPDRVTAWVAIFAILLAALAPTLARARWLSQQPAGQWGDICTAAGLHIDHDAEAPLGSGRHDGLVLKHCTCCLSQLGHFTLPTAPLDWGVAANLSTEAFPFSATSPSPRFVRAAAQPRAPPALS